MNIWHRTVMLYKNIMRFIFNPFTWCKGQIKQWLAQMGAERLDEIADPEQYNGPPSAAATAFRCGCSGCCTEWL